MSLSTGLVLMMSWLLILHIGIETTSADDPDTRDIEGADVQDSEITTDEMFSNTPPPLSTRFATGSGQGTDGSSDTGVILEDSTGSGGGINPTDSISDSSGGGGIPTPTPRDDTGAPGNTSVPAGNTPTPPPEPKANATIAANTSQSDEGNIPTPTPRDNVTAPGNVSVPSDDGSNITIPTPRDNVTAPGNVSVPFDEECVDCTTDISSTASSTLSSTAPSTLSSTESSTLTSTVPSTMSSTMSSTAEYSPDSFNRSSPVLITGPTIPPYGTRRPPVPCYQATPTPTYQTTTEPREDYYTILEYLHRGYYDVPEYNLTYESDAWFYSVGYSEIDSYPPCPTEYDNGYGSEGYPYEGGYIGGDNTYPGEYYEGGGGGGGGDDDYNLWGPPCTRKEYRQLSDQERNNFHAALNAMKSNSVGGISEYDIFASKHIGANSPGAHRGAAFLPWHREYLKRFEQALRLHDPTVCLPYWDSTLDSYLPTPADSAIWTEDYLGNNDGPVTSGPFQNWVNLPHCATNLRRNAGNGGRCFQDGDIGFVMSRTMFQDLVSSVDPRFEGNHGQVHVFVGGNMGGTSCAPADPVFYMHHTFIDCIWEEFRRNHQVTVPWQEYPQANGHHAAYDHMDPWINLYNIQGISRLYTQYYYNCSQRPVSCDIDSDCGGAMLWCDTDDNRCKSKVRQGGDCTGFPNACCAGPCSSGLLPVCEANTCSCGDNTTVQVDHFHRDWYTAYRICPGDQEYAWFFSVGYTAVEQYDAYQPSYPGYPVDGGTVPGGGPYTWTPLCQRKEYRQLTSTERHNLHAALNALKNTMAGPILSEYDTIVAFHRGAESPGAHRGAAFLPWHRQYLNILEMALRLHFPDVCLPYWDSTLDSHLPNPEDSAIWTSGYLGNNIGPVTSGPFAGWGTVQSCGNGLTRNSGPSGRTFLASDIAAMFSKTRFQDITCNRDCSFENAHGSVHVFVGGQMSSAVCAPCDPVFFMHHAFIDCLWEEFRNDHQVTPPQFEYPATNIGGADHHPFDRMDPWVDLYNIHGLGDHYTGYYYNCAARPNSCTDDASTGTDVLWCDNGQTKAKVRQGGTCNGFPDNACYCPLPNTNPDCSYGVCVCRSY